MAPKLRKSNYWLAWPSSLRRTEKRRVAAATKLAAADHRKDTAYVEVLHTRTYIKCTADYDVVNHRECCAILAERSMHFGLAKH